MSCLGSKASTNQWQYLVLNLHYLFVSLSFPPILAQQKDKYISPSACDLSIFVALHLATLKLKKPQALSQALIMGWNGDPSSSTPWTESLCSAWQVFHGLFGGVVRPTTWVCKSLLSLFSGGSTWASQSMPECTLDRSNCTLECYFPWFPSEYWFLCRQICIGKSGPLISLLVHLISFMQQMQPG